MKSFREKCAKVLAYIYGIGISISLFVGAFSILGYIVAIIIGGQTAADICEFIYKDIYPVIIYMSSVSVLLGIAKMYVAGQKSLMAQKKK